MFLKNWIFHNLSQLNWYLPQLSFDLTISMYCSYMDSSQPGGLWNKQCVFVLWAISHHIKPLVPILSTPLSDFSSRQNQPARRDSQLMPHLFTHMHTHIITVDVSKRALSRHFYSYTHTHKLKSTHSPYKVGRTDKQNHTLSVSLCSPSESLSRNTSLRGLAWKYVISPQLWKQSAMESAWVLLFILS